MARRSVLFTPGNRREMLRGAAETEADVLVFDLEDGVGPGEKTAARETVVDVVTDPSFDPDAELWVRVNPVHSVASAAASEHDRDGDASRIADSDEEPSTAATAGADVRALAPAADAVDGLVLPKVRSGADVRRLAGLARRHGLPRSVLALVESARGVRCADEIAAAGATDALVFGAEDLAADLGATRSEEGREVASARQDVVAAARAAGVDAIDTLWTSFRDLDGLRSDAARAVALGFDGKLAIHPDQVQPINDAFRPDEDDLEWARRVLDAREESGGGAFAVDGEMIDAPLIARAERIVDRARADEDASEPA